MAVEQSSEQLNELKSFLRKLFQFESADLDFGIYKILNYKRKEIEQFIDELLTNTVREQLKIVAAVETEKLRADVLAKEETPAIENYLAAVKANDTKRIAIYENDFGAEITRYKKLRAQYDLQMDTAQAEPLIYNHLTIFFSRYYDKGDFISKRRYGKSEKYMVPYNGEETYFHWANADQYYIKSTEFFRKYSFRIPSPNGHSLVHFKIKEAEEEQGNVRSNDNKYFILAEPPVEIAGSDINIFFEYRALSEQEKETKGKNQEALNKYAVPLILAALGSHAAVAELNKPVNDTVKLALELNRYTARNKFDFFIHKDLKGFLTRELDFYIKSELIKLDDLTVFDTETHYDTVRLQFTIVKTFKKIATTIIDFISQVEDFQKRLWEKKKFVLTTHYVLTLDRLAAYTSAPFADEIAREALKNERQIEEWKQLFGDEIFKNWNKLSLADLKENGTYRKLPVDTVYFNEEFKWKLLCEISKKHQIDDVADGLVLHSDNFQGISLIQEKLQKQIKGIYIDPPYNTAATEILYKNEFKHSSWSSLIFDRIKYSKELLSIDGMICITIDDAEYNNLLYIAKKVFGEQNYLATVAIRNNPSGRSTVTGFSVNHEYALFFSNGEEFNAVGKLPHSDKQIDRYSEIESDGRRYEWENLRRNGPESNREDRPKQYYPIYIDKNSSKLRCPLMSWDQVKKVWVVNEKPFKHEKEVFPLHPNGTQKVWRYSKEDLENDSQRYMWVEKDGNIEIYRKKYLNNDGLLPRTWWDNPLYSARDNGTRDLVNLFNGKNVFDFPKAVHAVKDCIKVCNVEDGEYVLDFFPGSGTTFHANLILNSLDNSKRKTILIEQGDYIYSIILPRIKKIAYSFDWKTGKPQSTNGLGVFLKYQRLEQYEESLENIAFSAEQSTTQLHMQFKEYIPKYFLHFESSGSNTLVNIDAMKNPFAYTLKVFENYGYVEHVADVVETFNYLIGLHIHGYKKSSAQQREYLVVTGKDRQNRNIVVVWRNAEELDYDKDRETILSLLEGIQYDVLYVNHQCTIAGAMNVEEVFATRMG